MIQRAYMAGRLPGRRLDEVNGYADLGLFAEACVAARELLHNPSVSGEVFDTCVNMVLSCAEDLGAWKDTIQWAYQRMSADGRRRSAYLMLWFYTASEDHARAAQFIPGKFSGPLALVNLLFAMNIYLGLKRLDKAQRLIPRCQRAARVASHPEMRTMLTQVLADYRREVDLLRAQQSEREKWKSIVEGTSSTSP